MTITRVQMLNDINGWLCGIAEQIEGPITGSYVVTDRWINLKGERVRLAIDSNSIIQGYNAYDCKDGYVVDFIKRQEENGNSTLVERLWRFIKAV